jgi:hypothetical protein
MFATNNTSNEKNTKRHNLNTKLPNRASYKLCFHFNLALRYLTILTSRRIAPHLS